MDIKYVVLPIVSTFVVGGLCAAESSRPNVVIIIADDIGYGDLGCYGATRIKTPNVDRLAERGVRFTNAYAPASTSSPTRYSLLTGEYAWRKGVGIMAGDAPLAIDTERNTLPKQMKSVGYEPAIVGKWHLGLGTEEHPADYNHKIKRGGMRDVGFDYSFIYPATNDRVPTIYMECDKTVGLDRRDPIEVSYSGKVGDDPTGSENPNLLRLVNLSKYHSGTIVNGVSRIGWMSGGEAARWRDEELTEDLLAKATEFIDDNADSPFFLYFAAHTAHEPRVAGARFQGVSEAGPYGDVIEEFDYSVGEIEACLSRNGVLDNTLIIVTSDNGPMVKEGYDDGAAEGIGDHDPFGGLRGAKYSLLEGGTRVPFVAAWGDEIESSSIQSQRFCYIDMLATLAHITESEANLDGLHDSVNAAELFFDAEAPTYRPYILTQNNPGHIALRRGEWKYIPAVNRQKRALYNLESDPSEQNNLTQSDEYSAIISKFEMDINSLVK
ncbi:MAG: sulfatase-like hydrolase/transferase [Rikenellaceae bacterium]